MALLVRMLRQYAVYWPPAGLDNFGKPQYGTPIEIKVRWEDCNTEVLSAEGEKTLSNAKVYANLNDLQVRGMLLLGRLSTITDWTNPLGNRDFFGTPLARRIIKFEKMGDLKVKHFLRVAYVN